MGHFPATAQELPPPNGAGWQLEQDKDGVAFYERELDGVRTRESYAVTRIEFPAWRVWRALRDYSSFPEWVPYSEEARVTAREPGIEYVFQRMDLPWPVGNRYFTLRQELSVPEAPEGAYSIQWDLAPAEKRFACEDCGVETPVNRGQWSIEPLEGGASVLLRCQALSDPGGHLPGFAVRAANEKMFPKVVAAVRERTALPQYAEAPKEVEP